MKYKDKFGGRRSFKGRATLLVTCSGLLKIKRNTLPSSKIFLDQEMQWKDYERAKFLVWWDEVKINKNWKEENKKCEWCVRQKDEDMVDFIETGLLARVSKQISKTWSLRTPPPHGTHQTILIPKVSRICFQLLCSLVHI